MRRHHAVADDDPDPLDRPDHRQRVVGERGGDRVVVGVEADQRQRVGRGLPTRAGLERLGRQRQQRRPLLGEQLGLGRRLAPHRALQVGPAGLLQLGVERLQVASTRGTRHQEVPAGEADQVLDVALLVGPPHQAEVVAEQVMALEPQELVGQLPLAAAQ